MQHLRLWWNRLLSWREARRAPREAVIVPDFVALAPSLSRDVSCNGIRFYSLCGTCGERLESSATLCDDCARKRSGYSTNY